FEKWDQMDPSLVQRPYGEAASGLQWCIESNSNLFQQQRRILLDQIFLGCVYAISTHILPALPLALWNHIFSYLHQDDLRKSATEVKKLSSYFFKNAKEIRQQIYEEKAIRSSERIAPDEGFLFKSDEIKIGLGP